MSAGEYGTRLREVSKDVLAFHEKYGHPTEGVLGRMFPSAFRMRLIDEEKDEMAIGLMTGDPVETLDGAIDLIYVILGTLIACGFRPPDIERAWWAVHESNMKKVPNGSEKPSKPDGWTPPDLSFAKRVVRDA